MSTILRPQTNLAAVAAIDGPAIGNTNVQTSLLPANGIVTIPGGSMGVGAAIRQTVTGRFSNRAAAPGNFTFDVKLGGALVWTSGALALGAALRTNVAFWLELLLTCRTNGPNATVFGVGLLHVDAGGQGHYMLPSAAPVASAPFDATIDRDLDVFATWSVADPGNTMTMHQYLAQA